MCSVFSLSDSITFIPILERYLKSNDMNDLASESVGFGGVQLMGNPVVEFELKLMHVTIVDAWIRLLSQLPQLQSIIFSACQIDDERFTKILDTLYKHADGKLINYLEFSSNTITTLKGVETFLNLEMLDFYDNRVKEIPRNLEDLVHLNYLSLTKNEMTGVCNITKLTQLGILLIGNNQLTSIITSSDQVYRMAWIRANNNRLTSIAFVENLIGLIQLSLDGNQITSIASLSRIHTKLEWLNLARNNITDISSLGNVRSLTLLSICNNKIENASILEHLDNIKSTYLYTCGNPFDKTNNCRQKKEQCY